MRILLALSVILLSLACSSDKETQDNTGKTSPAQTAQTGSFTEGFLGVPWGTAPNHVQAQWLMRPISEMGDITVYQTAISTYKNVQIQSTTAAFRSDKLIGIGFEIPSPDAIARLVEEFNTTYGGAEKKPTSQVSTGEPINADSLGVQTVYRWETSQSTAVLMRVHGGTSYVFIMQQGESLPQLG